MEKNPASHDFRETVRLDIRQGAVLDWQYASMNILSALIASYGLLANSPAVVIGAMIVAMLLGPINGLALALVESDPAVARQALITLLIGGLLVFATAVVIGMIHEEVPLTNEIMTRTSPNLFDLMIALGGGAAGALATITPRLSVAFVGVAVATALVPPLASAGILVARGDFDLGRSALILVFTNMVGIQFAGSVVLWLNGFRGLTRITGLQSGAFLKRNLVSIVVLLLLAVILTANLHRVISRQLFETSTSGILRREINAIPGNRLALVKINRTQNVTIVRAVVRGPAAPTPEEVAALEKKLPPPGDGSQLELRLRFVQATIINRDGLLYNGAELNGLDD
jgi:uncharacterized hydrophobic protein (TIGR00271 family)